MELPGKEFKPPVLNMLKELKETMDKDLKKSRRTRFHDIENIDKETELLKKEMNRNFGVAKHNLKRKITLRNVIFKLSKAKSQ